MSEVTDEAREFVIRGMFIAKMRRLHRLVAELRNFYEENPWLNDVYNIEKLIPMSVDEWEVELRNWLLKFPA